MENNLIEKYDCKLYRLIACLTVLVGVITVVYVWFNLLRLGSGNQMITNNPVLYWRFVYIQMGLVAILIIFAVWLLAVRIKIRRNKKLKEALGSEMNRDSENKSVKVGFFVLVLLLAACGFVVDFYPEYASVIMRSILLVGGLSMLGSWLYYNREIS